MAQTTRMNVVMKQAPLLGTCQATAQAVAAMLALLGCGQVAAQTFGDEGSSLGIQLRMMEELGHRKVLPPDVGTLDFGSRPRVFKEGAYATSAEVVRLEMKLSGAGAPADGTSRLMMTVKAYTASGALLKGPGLITVEHSGGRLDLPQQHSSHLASAPLDQDRRTPGTQIRLVNGEASFALIAPYSPQDVRLRVTAGDVVLDGVIPFDAELREMVAAGLIEGILRINKQHYDSAVAPARLDDGFERELRAFSKSFKGKQGTAAARAAVFLKGKIRGDALLSLAYDTEKESRGRLLQTVQPDAYYPVYGDASITGFDASSSGKLFVRVDKQRSFVLYGDFNTGSGFTQSAGSGLVAGGLVHQLGAYNRTLNGARGHVEGAQGYGNVYAARDTLRQVVDEVLANGTSGPFSVSSSHALENSEKIEVLTRDKNDLRRIIGSQPLQRFVDYSFEPFSGRILLARPLSSLDEQGNLHSLRISYEVDQGGAPFWTFGADGQLQLSPALSVGGSAVEDQNPMQPFSLRSVNASVKLGGKTTLVAELAQTHGRQQALGLGRPVPQPGTASDQVSGLAGRLELHHDGESLKLRAWVSRSGNDFANANAGVMPGTQQMGGTVNARLTPDLSVNVDAREVKDLTSDAKRVGATVALSYQVSPGLQVSGGVRHSEEQGRVSGMDMGLGANPAPGSAYFPGASGGFPGVGGNSAAGLGNVNNIGLGTGANPGAVPDLNANTAFMGLRVRVGERLNLTAAAEAGLQSSTQRRLLLGARYQVNERTGLYARAESQTGLASYYGLDPSQRSHAVSLGIDSSYMVGGNFFSEYRLRDAMNGREQQLASGVRHAWQLDEGLMLTTGAERLSIQSSTPQTATALTGSLDYTADELWKGSARAEWRRLDGAPVPGPNGAAGVSSGTQDSLLLTLGAARKLSRDWTGLARNYTLAQSNHGARPDGWQNRFQLGAAYRPVDESRLDVLSLLEHKVESQINGGGEWRRVAVGSVHANYHPSRAWWWSGRLAAKQVNERFPLLEGGALSQYRAWLLGARVVYDITENWDLGLMLSHMQGGANAARQRAIGLEAGYLLRQNLWLSAGYNFSGFSDRDLSNDYTAQGAYIRLRFKFDQSLFSASHDDSAPR